jgi:hypothetical protein
VSTRDQHPEAQHDALAAAGCDKVFVDKASGRLASRPELDKALLSANRPGDQLVVTKLDRLGRSLEHLIELSKLLQTRGVDLVVLDQGIDTSTAVGRLFISIIGAIAEFEHALMSERTMDGLATARARGRTGGLKPKLGPPASQAGVSRKMPGVVHAFRWRGRRPSPRWCRERLHDHRLGRGLASGGGMRWNGLPRSARLATMTLLNARSRASAPAPQQ